MGGRPSAVRRLVYFATFYTIRIDYGVSLYDNSYYQCQITPFLTDIYKMSFWPMGRETFEKTRKNTLVTDML
jgi:hypothetical protein